MKKTTEKRRGRKVEQILNIERFPQKEQAGLAVQLLRACGIEAATDNRYFHPGAGLIFSPGKTLLWIRMKDSRRADKILELARLFGRPWKKVALPTQEGTMEFLDELIHDCRQYLMIATGELKSISEEGELALDEPTNDISKISIRLKRLKDQCMRQAGGIPLDWEHGGGLGIG